MNAVADDRVLNKLVLASVDEEVANLLYKDIYVLTKAEKAIQAKGPEFLKRAGIHAILSALKMSEKVKEQTKNRINAEKVARFLPMCVAMQRPAPGAEDIVSLYGLDRERDRELLERLWTEAHAVSRACYLHGYRKAVSGLEPYLENAGYWYNELATAQTHEIALADWANRATCSDHDVRLYSLRNKLEILWQVAQEDERLRAQLRPSVPKPEDVLLTLNSAVVLGMRDHILWDATAQQHLHDVSTLSKVPTSNVPTLSSQHHFLTQERDEKKYSSSRRSANSSGTGPMKA